jgi:type III pantothenate kinase
MLGWTNSSIGSGGFMLLALDIGNTNIVAGVFSGEALIARWRLTTEARRTSDEYAVLLHSLFRVSDVDGANLDQVIIASVVPVAQETLRGALQQYWHLEPMTVTHRLDFGIPVRYNPSTAVGADRLANAVAAIAGYGTPAIVVDFGTATTFDVISNEGEYLGGAIAPGLEISQDALLARTAQLPHFSLQPPPAAIGTSTVTSLQSGILFGYAGLVDGLVERIAGELGGDVHVIATGGLATTVSPLATKVRHVDVDLTLVGLRLIHERNS